MDEVMKLQKDKSGNYACFVKFILSAVVGKRNFKLRKHKCLLSSYATISDEVYALLNLENNLERWMDMHEKQNF